MEWAAEVGSSPSQEMYKNQSYKKLTVKPRKGCETRLVTLRCPCYLKNLKINEYQEKIVVTAG